MRIPGASPTILSRRSRPVYDMQSTRLCAGGAANTAANVAALGAKVSLMTVIGKDERATDCCISNGGSALIPIT